MNHSVGTSLKRKLNKTSGSDFSTTSVPEFYFKFIFKMNTKDCYGVVLTVCDGSATELVVEQAHVCYITRLLIKINVKLTEPLASKKHILAFVENDT